MNATLISHYVSQYEEECFKIKKISFYDVNAPSACLVFCKEKFLRLENGLIIDAMVINENSIELEILTHTGKIIYCYYYADLSECVIILDEDSEIILSRKCDKENEDMETLVYASEQIFEQAIFC